MSKKILFPAIDLKDGECVRLKLGDMDQATVYNTDPGAQAKAFEDQGFEWLHVVDLNGAFAGESVNAEAVEAILKATKNPVQLGGGIRTLDHIEAWLSKGLTRVILGTVAVRDPELVIEACKKFPGHIAVGIDAKGGKVAVEGWAEASELGVIELAQKFEDVGVSAIIYTDIDRDGILTGINWESTIELSNAVSIPVIASGGLASIDDVKRMTEPDCEKLEGAITGRALYDGRLETQDALVYLHYSGMNFTGFPDLTLDRKILVLSVIRASLMVVTSHFVMKENPNFNSWNNIFKLIEEGSLDSLSKSDCELCLEALHHTIYGLGAFELNILTPHTLREFSSVGLLLYDRIHGAYTGTLWSEDEAFL